MNAHSNGLVPVHVGQPPPGSQAEKVLLATLQHTQTRGWDSPARPRVSATAAWQANSLEPRWLGMESADCAAALEPTNPHGSDGEGLKRFLRGANHRGEIALVIAMIGDAENTNSRNVFGNHDASVDLPISLNRVAGRRLPSGTRPQLVQDLSTADRDLAMRLKQRPADSPWWSLELHGTTMSGMDGRQETHDPVGTLQPLLVDDLDNPIAAVWVDPSQSQRWYIVPDQTDVDQLLSWLTSHGLQFYVPEALRRARSVHFVDPALQTTAELSARQKLADLETEYTVEKARLQLELRQAETTAELTRYGLLYGSGSTLVTAVNAALAAAGLAIVDLDTELEGTKSADLLVLADGHRILTEVKAVGRRAPEDLVDDLKRHLLTWPQLRPFEPATDGLLIVNHQHKLPPADRTREVYSRSEFVQALDVRVLSSLELFEHWRTEDWSGLRKLVLGATRPGAAPAEPSTQE